jgi:methionyl-tRNA formyltransferase
LPRHPGRNAEAWAIFEQDSETGITWHMITEKVDAGKILIQKKVSLDEHMTSIQLLKKQHSLAVQGFTEILEDVVNSKMVVSSPNNNLRGQLHYSWEVPNDGVLSLDWDGAKMSAFLRAMDYGILDVLGKPSVIIDGVGYTWKKYLIERSEVAQNMEFVDFEHGSVIIQRGNTKVTLIHFSRKPTL